MVDTTDDVVETAAETAPVEEVAETPDFAAEAEKWKALARKNEQRAKENADKAKRLDELEDANRTELEKLQAQLAAAQSQAAAAEAARLKATVAARHGVPEALLSGSTEDELEDAARALLEFKGKNPAAPSSDGQGKAGDAISNSVKQITSLDELNRLSPAEVNQARREGRLDKLLGKS